MTTVRTESDGRVVVESPAYRLEFHANGRRADLLTPGGDHRLSLRLLAAIDRTDGPDETLSVEPPRVVEGDELSIEIDRRSTLWERAGLTVVCRDEQLEVRSWVEGSGVLTEGHLLAGRSLIPGAPLGYMPTGSSYRTLFTPNPEDAVRLTRAAGESALTGVIGDGEPGRAHWLFTPAPLYFALHSEEVADPEQRVDEGWLDVTLVAPVDELTFVEVGYRAAERAFSLVLDYDGHTAVDARFDAPIVLLTLGVPDPYTGLRRHRDDLVARGSAPAPEPRSTPAWWTEPIFCGWGAQCYLERDSDVLARDFATQANYDAWLDHLERRDVVPGIVVLDDKWQTAYGTNEPDVEKWPDLRAWIAQRHERGQHVLLWWKAWDPEGFPTDLCVRNADGRAVGLDPSNHAARDELRRVIARMLSPSGLDADGLKIDFTARTPSGRALTHHGSGWGIALLHELLSVVYAAAKEAKPDALVITHTPHPSFVDVTDMIRLNDMLRPGEVVRQMQFRAHVSRAACPEVLIDTDDWCIPDKRTWREFLEVKPDLGVPSLYYATHLDATGEELLDDDFAALRTAWERWRRTRKAAA